MKFKISKAEKLCCGAAFMLLLSTAFTAKAFGQNLVPDTSLQKSRADSIIRLTNGILGSNSLIYTGTEYIGYSPLVKGHAFHETDTPILGSVFYDGVLYREYPVKYDVVQDELLLIPGSESIPIKLLKQKINYFYLNNDLFIKMVSDTTDGASVTTGFYQVLHRGNVTALAKRRKQIVEARRAEEVSRFVQYDQFYLKRNNLYYRISNNRELLSLLKDKREELRKFQRRNNLVYRKDPAQVIASTTEYYSQLTR